MIVDLARNDLSRVGRRAPGQGAGALFGRAICVGSWRDDVDGGGRFAAWLRRSPAYCARCSLRLDHRRAEASHDAVDRRTREHAVRGLNTGAIGWLDAAAAGTGGLGWKCVRRLLHVGRHSHADVEAVGASGIGARHDGHRRGHRARQRRRRRIRGVSIESAFSDRRRAGLRAVRNHATRRAKRACVICRAISRDFGKCGSAGLSIRCRSRARTDRGTMRGVAGKDGASHASRARQEWRNADHGGDLERRWPTRRSACLLATDHGFPSMQSGDPLLHHKTTRRAEYDRALARGRGEGAFDTLFFNERGELTEGGRSNVFVKLAGKWWTPPLDVGRAAGRDAKRCCSRTSASLQAKAESADAGRTC